MRDGPPALSWHWRHGALRGRISNLKAKTQHSQMHNGVWNIKHLVCNADLKTLCACTTVMAVDQLGMLFKMLFVDRYDVSVVYR